MPPIELPMHQAQVLDAEPFVTRRYCAATMSS